MNLHAGSLAHALCPGIQFFLLAKEDSRVHTLITQVASLEEEVKYSIVKITGWKIVQTIQAVSLTVGFVGLILGISLGSSQG